MAEKKTTKKSATAKPVKKATNNEKATPKKVVTNKVNTSTETSKSTKKVVSKTSEKSVSKPTKKVVSKKSTPKKVIEVLEQKEEIKITPKEIISEKKATPDSKSTTYIKNLTAFELVIILVIVTIIGGLFGYGLSSNFYKTNNKDFVTADKEIQKFIEQYNNVLENYYGGEINKNELIKAAIEGMLSKLDAHSGVIDDNASNSFNITLEGSFQGIGVEIINDNSGNIIIMKVIDNSPAFKAGLQAGDIITKLNGKDLKNVSTSDFVKMVKECNTQNVAIEIKRNEQLLNFDLKRELVTLKSVEHKMLDNKIGYIYVNVFAANTYDQFRNALNDLESQQMSSLIIDLRGNSGGHLDVVGKMLSLFMDKTHIIYQTQNKDGIEKVYSTGNTTKQYKIAILTDGASASGSEVMAAALSEELNAILVGTTTYGKGTVQQLHNVADVGQYKFTTKKWLTPKGNWIDGVGINPNVEIELSNEYMTNPIFENDNQLQEAIKQVEK